jgi:hypothetical protein
MKIIITENQKRIILTESLGEEVADVIKQNDKRVNTIISDIKGKVDVNIKFLLTWGAGIGGFIAPVEDFLRGEFPELSSMDVSLILTAIIFTYFSENEESLKNIKKKILENDLSEPFFRTLTKSEELYKTFFKFIKSLGGTLQTMINMLSYTFIIPILPLIYNMVSSGFIDNSNYEEIAKRIVGFTGLTISSVLFERLLKKLIRRFKS